MTGPTVVADGTRFGYGGDDALWLERLVCEPGITAVLGPNGSGKSTLLRLLASVTQPDAGTVRVGGLDLGAPAHRTAVRKRLGYLGQDDGLPPRMTVGEFLDYVGVLKELPQRRRHEWSWWALQRVGLEDQVDHRIKTLSGGMRRRLALAQALLGGPELLVLDEPAASLDPDYRHSIASLLVELASSATVIAATHHPEDIAAVATRIVILDHGKVVFSGSPASLLAKADGFVWEADRQQAARASWAVGPRTFRHVGDAPAGAHLVAPRIEDGYLLCVDPAAVSGDRGRRRLPWLPAARGSTKRSAGNR